MQLQENKTKNLSIDSPKLNGIIIKTGEILSSWHIVGRCLEKDSN